MNGIDNADFTNMAASYTRVKKLEFIIEDKQTHCNVFYEATQPGTPWAGGWKTKTFDNSVTHLEILQVYSFMYLLWDDGRAD